MFQSPLPDTPPPFISILLLLVLVCFVVVCIILGKISLMPWRFPEELKVEVTYLTFLQALPCAVI